MSQTTGAKSAAAEPSPPPRMSAVPNIENLSIAELVESPLNPRKLFNQTRLEELAQSIRVVGRVVQALVARPKGKHYEIICGARRYRAARLAGLKFLPVDVQELTDEQVMEIMAIENGQREDVHPLEEAAGYRLLLDKVPGYTIARITERTGKDPSHVYRRLSLLNLIPKLRADFVNDQFTLGHALALARLEAPDQERAMKESLYESGAVWKDGKWNDGAGSLSNLLQWIDSHVLRILSSAPWDKRDELLVPAAGSCTACTKRSSANLALFEELAPKTDACLDGRCFERKTAAFLAKRTAEVAAAGIPPARLWDGYHHISQKSSGLVLRQDWYPAVSGCRDPRPGLIYGPAGGDVGKVIKVCLDKKCQQHRAGSPSRHERSPREAWDEKREQLGRQIDEAYRQRVLEEVVRHSIRISDELVQDLILAISEYSYGDDTFVKALHIEEENVTKIDEAIRKKVRGLSGAKLAQLATIAAYDPSRIAGKFDESPLFQAATQLKVKLGPIHRAIADPLLAKFEKDRAAAMAAAKKAKAKQKPKAAKGAAKK